MGADSDDESSSSSSSNSVHYRRMGQATVNDRSDMAFLGKRPEWSQHMSLEIWSSQGVMALPEPEKRVTWFSTILEKHMTNDFNHVFEVCLHVLMRVCAQNPSAPQETPWNHKSRAEENTSHHTTSGDTSRKDIFEPYRRVAMFFCFYGFKSY